MDVHKTSKIVFSDASSIRYGSYEVNTVNSIVHGMWSKEESLRSSTWHELCLHHDANSENSKAHTQKSKS